MQADKICSTCETDKYLKKKSVTYEFDVRGEKIPHTYDVLECLNCGELVSTPEQNDEMLKNIYDKYKSNHGLLTTDEIIAIRKHFGLSLRDFCKILGLSHVTYHRYEKGAIPEPSLNNLLLLIKENPNNIKKLFVHTKSNFDSLKAYKLKNTINEVLDDYLPYDCSDCFYLQYYEDTYLERNATMKSKKPYSYNIQKMVA